MAGRGRGASSFTFNIDALGIGRGNMPEARVGPSPLFPNTDFKPVPLKSGEDEEYMRALKQEMRTTMQRLPHNIKAHNMRAEVERYAERYLRQSRMMEQQEWTPDWSRLPRELMPQQKRPRPTAGKKTKPKKIASKDAAEVLSKLDQLEKQGEGNADKSDEEDEEKKARNEEEEEVEEYEEEEIEEENDYIESYFDNGEDFGANSDDNMDAEATY